MKLHEWLTNNELQLNKSVCDEYLSDEIIEEVGVDDQSDLVITKNGICITHPQGTDFFESVIELRQAFPLHDFTVLTDEG